MGKGSHIKKQERSCFAKAKFDTAEEAEAYAEYRFGAYRCPICHSFHLSRQAKATPPKGSPERRITLEDLNWKAVLDPEPKRIPSPKPATLVPVAIPANEPPAPPSPPSAPVRTAVIQTVRPDRSCLLRLPLQIVKSARLAVGHDFRAGELVEISEDVPPVILRRHPAIERRELDS